MNVTKKACLVVALAGGLLTLSVFATVPDHAETTPMAPATTVPAPSAPDYLLPDPSPQALVHDGRRFEIKPIIAIVTDYPWLEQDDESLAQVGEQEDTFSGCTEK